MDHKCHVCHKEAGGAHKCKKCQKAVAKPTRQFGHAMQIKVIIIIHFFRNSFLIRSKTQKHLHLHDQMSGWLRYCQNVVHLICGAAEDEEEYGQNVTCNVCRQHTTDGIELVYIRHTLYITRKWKIIFSCLYSLYNSDIQTCNTKN